MMRRPLSPPSVQNGAVPSSIQTAALTRSQSAKPKDRQLASSKANTLGSASNEVIRAIGYFDFQ